MTHTTERTEHLHQVRRANLRTLIARDGASQLAFKLGHRSGSFLAQLAGPRPTRAISEKLARAFEEALQLPVGWLDDEGHQMPAPALDDVLLAACCTELTGALDSIKRRLPPTRYAEVLAILYSQAARVGVTAPDQELVARLLRVVL